MTSPRAFHRQYLKGMHHVDAIAHCGRHGIKFRFTGRNNQWLPKDQLYFRATLDLDRHGRVTRVYFGV